MSDIEHQEDILEYTTEIVSAYLSNNSVEIGEISSVVEEVFSALSRVTSGGALVGDQPQPAVAIEDSVTPDYIVCLEDGKQLKMLKRYLMTAYKMTPDDYRERWGLPADYPMVAPSYAQKRSELAKNIGLGKRG